MFFYFFLSSSFPPFSLPFFMKSSFKFFSVFQFGQKMGEMARIYIPALLPRFDVYWEDRGGGGRLWIPRLPNSGPGNLSCIAEYPLINSHALSYRGHTPSSFVLHEESTLLTSNLRSFTLMSICSPVVVSLKRILLLIPA